MKQSTNAAILILMTVCFALGGFFLAKSIVEAQEYSESKTIWNDTAECYTDIIDQTNTDIDTILSQLTSEEDTGRIESTPITSPITIDFDELRQLNSDVVAWLYIPNTVINYPVVQGSDNSYYLNHLLNHSFNGGGTLFLRAEQDSSFQSDNHVIHGHAMTDKSMFGSLHNYRFQKDYYETHTVGFLLTPNADYLIAWFAGYVTEEFDATAYAGEFLDTASFEAAIADWRAKSLFDAPIDICAGDHILTLSTCAGGDYRFVLQGKMIELS